MNVFKKKIKRNRVYREYVDILNGKLQLSSKEAAIFAVLLQLNEEWGSMMKEMGSVLSTDVRRVLFKETLVTKSNLARYVKSLKHKGILVETESGAPVLNEMFIPKIDGDTFEIKYILELT